MRFPFSTPTSSALLLATILILPSGCGGRKGPAPADPQKTAASLDAAFASAPSEVRTVVQSASTSLRNNNTTDGFVALYGVSRNPELTPEQQRATGDALLSSLQELSKAAKNGDARAEKALAAYRARK